MSFDGQSFLYCFLKKKNLSFFLQEVCKTRLQQVTYLEDARDMCFLSFIIALYKTLSVRKKLCGTVITSYLVLD